MRRLQQSTSRVVMLKVFLSSDHVTAATGKTVAITISKNGGAFANPNAGATNATEVSSGWYKVTLDTTDTATVGDLVVRGTSASCDDSEQLCQVQSGIEQTGDSYARLGAPAGASISADIAGVQADTDNIQTRIPASLVSGRIDASVGAMAANVLTATAINADAITAAKIADGAIDAATFAAGAINAAAIAADAITDAKVASDVTIASVTGAVGSVTGNVGGNVTGSVGSVATGGISAASFAAGAIDNAAIATDAIGSAELAASAVTEIQTGLSTLDAAAVRTAVGLGSANLDTQLSGINAKTTNLPSDPADASDIAGAFSTVNGTLATIAGYIDTEVGAIKAKTDNLPAAPAAVADIPTANANADALLDRAAGIETGLTLRQAMRLVGSALFGKVSGAGTTTETVRDFGDSKDRLVYTVDASGNRTAITRDAT